MRTLTTLAAILSLTIGIPQITFASSSVPEKREPAAAFIPQEGKQFITLPRALSSQPKVIEFFSFYCGPCYKFFKDYPVVDAINRTLPAGESVTKYHVSALGPLGNELSEAWAIAMVMGKTKEVEGPLFAATQNKTLKSADDIQAVFVKSGIDAASYQSARQSMMVKAVIARQKEAADLLGVQSTPSFYVDGKYKINIAGIPATTPADYAESFAEIVNALLK